MKFIADFHIHSHYSIATSKQLVPEHLDYWGRMKGIKVVGTGDFTHPGWIKELKEKLEPAESGLFKLKQDLRIHDQISVPNTEENEVRFILTAEISNIYKKNDKTRKVHNVVFAPDFETVDRIQQALRQHGFNITSDGRPILGLDSRDLLEICLQSSERIFFVPAHIWTPWFSALGSKSGFDRIEDCYADLSDHIFAVETGLSSDPPMNWLCSFLDRYTLISNSDAHSPEKLGREANRFDIELSYDSILRALKNKASGEFLGTLEFFPQEGKYHHDGHRKCGISWEPRVTREHHGICPVCGKKVTVGVMNRVIELADRESPSKGLPFHSLIPLKEILSEIAGVGPNSKQVIRDYHHLIHKLGSEFDILLHLPLEDIRHAGSELLAEGIRRMRDREVQLQPGFDGEYGVIRVFGDELKNKPGLQNNLFEEEALESLSEQTPSRDSSVLDVNLPEVAEPCSGTFAKLSKEPPSGINLNEDQLQAVRHFQGPAIILSGPGTGKTRVLTERIVHLIREHCIDPGNILAVTFTNKAAQEMRERLEASLSSNELSGLTICTFHALGYQILQSHGPFFDRETNFTIIDSDEQSDILKELIGDASQIKFCIKLISEHKQHCLSDEFLDDSIRLYYQKYETFLVKYNLFDLDDLICKPVKLFRDHPDICKLYQQQFQWVMVDEYQDINEAQYQLVRMLKKEPDANLCVIGDPNQAIYGFRGANVQFIHQFQTDFPNAMKYTLQTTYRCSHPILNASLNIIQKQSGLSLKAIQEGVKIQIVKNVSDKSEAEFIARTIESLMGGLRFFSMDSDITQGEADAEWSLSDFAVLCRTGRQMPVIERAFYDHSIPYQAIGDSPFFREKSIRKILDILKWSRQPENDYLSKRMSEGFECHLDDIQPLQNLASLKLKFTWMQEHLSEKIPGMTSDLWKQLGNYSASGDQDVTTFLKLAGLGMAVDTYQPAIERVTLMTLHAAKGLEFPIVFIAGCEDGLLPYHLWDRISDTDEERRLLYVGMTRAKHLLYLTYAQKRLLMGCSLTPDRSPFLDAIEREWMEMHEAAVKSKPRTVDNQLGLFA